MDEQTLHAERVKKMEFAGRGAAIQLVALIACVILGATMGIVGVLIGVGLFIWGSFNAFSWICGHCGNRIDGSHVKICPTCKASFENGGTGDAGEYHV